MRGHVDIDLIKQAWLSIVARHDVFRTAFVAWDSEQLLQLVVAEVELPWYQVDWRQLSAEQQMQEFERYRRQDIITEFVLEQAPLMRCAVFQEADNCYRFLWSHYHCLLDGWSVPLVLQELFDQYQCYNNGETVNQPAPRYRDYVAWLLRQDSLSAMDFWRQQLLGVTEPSLLTVDELPGGNDAGIGRKTYPFSISQLHTEQLQQLARTWHVTVNTLIQASWAYLLYCYSGNNKFHFYRWHQEVCGISLAWILY